MAMDSHKRQKKLEKKSQEKSRTPRMGSKTVARLRPPIPSRRKLPHPTLLHA
jgi:hypothetical protein